MSTEVSISSSGRTKTSSSREGNSSHSRSSSRSLVKERSSKSSGGMMSPEFESPPRLPRSSSGSPSKSKSSRRSKKNSLASPYSSPPKGKRFPDHSEIWKITNPVPDGADPSLVPTHLTFFERSGNGFHLAAIVRKYTGARMNLRGSVGQVKVEIDRLYDALGLFRSLQYDVALYNSIHNTDDSIGLIKYKTFRLSKQASAFGVRMPAGSNSVVEVPGLDALVAYLEEFHQEKIAVAKSNVAAGIVDFDSLAEYLKPGKEVVDHGVGTGFHIPTLMRVRSCHYQRGKNLFGVSSTFTVAMEFVIHIGENKFAVVEAPFPQTEFQGTRSVMVSLEMFTIPSSRLLQELGLRGHQYEKVVCGDNFKQSNGDSSDGTSSTKAKPGSPRSSKSGTGSMVEYIEGSFVPTDQGSLSMGKTNRQGNYGQASRSGGRMIVDTSASWHRGVHCANSTGVCAESVISTLKLCAQKRAQQQSAEANGSADHYSTTNNMNADHEDLLNDVLLVSYPLPEELIAMTWPTVPGFSLQARCWGVAMVHGTHRVQFNEQAFDALVMTTSRKKLIQALVTSHDDSRRQSADLISGKGEGSIFLLHGPPGVGKTLTAEAIAEMLHKPLYVVSMGELGTTPDALEERLQDILDLCIPWKALVLIDEAEMLLERRTKNDIVRNAMVCVMLRLLEYYSGILFLTTNRVESLDPAFQSRVTCALRYDPLSPAAREEIWINMMRRLKGINLEDFDTAELATHDINGRQIKNTLQLAVALASHENVPLSQQHLNTTLDITTSFLLESTKEEMGAIELD